MMNETSPRPWVRDACKGLTRAQLLTLLDGILRECGYESRQMEMFSEGRRTLWWGEERRAWAEYQKLWAQYQNACQAMEQRYPKETLRTLSNEQLREYEAGWAQARALRDRAWVAVDRSERLGERIRHSYGKDVTGQPLRQAPDRTRQVRA